MSSSDLLSFATTNSGSALFGLYAASSVQLLHDLEESQREFYDETPPFIPKLDNSV